MTRIGETSDLLKCSFCGKTQKQVKKLIAGPGVYICDECIELCNEIIIEELAEAGTLGLTELPAFVLIKSDGSVPNAAQGWTSADWKEVAAAVAALTNWSRPTIPAPGDPGSFRGTPALV